MALFDEVLVLDDAVPEEMQVHIENIFMSTNVAWTFNPSSLYVGGKLLDGTADFPQTKNMVDTPLMTHICAFNHAKSSAHLDTVFPVIEAIPHDMTKLLRVKVNISTPTPGTTPESHNPVHVDAGIEEDYLTGIYYINDADGDTFIFNEKKGHQGELTLKQQVSPKRGRLVVFNGNYLHAGGLPTKGPRLVININGF
jgi:hypothetical protein